LYKNSNMRAFIIVFVLTFLSSCQETKKESVTMKEDVYVLADDNFEGREIATLGERLAAEYIVQRFTDLELQPKGTDGYYQNFSFKPSTNPHEKAAIVEKDEDSLATGMNVVGYIDNKAETTVVIGAHYDHLGRFGGYIYNGSDDNASDESGRANLTKMTEIIRLGFLTVWELANTEKLR